MLLAMVIVMCVTGCGKKKENVTENEIDNEETTKEYKTLEYVSNIFKRENAPSTYILEAGGKEYTLEYTDSSMDNTYDVMDDYVYITEKGSYNENRNGILHVYLNSKNNEIYRIEINNFEFPYWEQETSFVNSEEAFEALKEMAQKYIDIDEYDMEFYDTEDYYKIECVRYIEGIATEECFAATFFKRSYAFATIMTNELGNYKDFDLGDFSDEDAQKVALEKMIELHGDHEYEISQKRICTVGDDVGICYAYVNEEIGIGQFIFVWLE